MTTLIVHNHLPSRYRLIKVEATLDDAPLYEQKAPPTDRPGIVGVELEPGRRHVVEVKAFIEAPPRATCVVEVAEARQLNGGSRPAQLLFDIVANEGKKHHHELFELTITRDGLPVPRDPRLGGLSYSSIPPECL